MPHTPTIPYRRDIEGLRAVAVLPVVLGHAGIAGFSGGFIGVDIFFVISGFLITGILLRELETGHFSILAFYERRIRRILPALFAVLLATLAAGWFLLPPESFRDLGISALATLFFASNLWFLRQTGDYFAEASDLEPLLHTWSLAVEEQFYIFFPLLLWVLVPRGRIQLRRVTLAVCAISLCVSAWSVFPYPAQTFFLLPTRIWELGLGALLAMGAFGIPRHRWVGETVAGLGAVAILGSIGLLDSNTAFPGLAAIPACFGTAALIWAGSNGNTTMVGRVLSTRPAIWVGLLSYSLYLWHWPILAYARLVTGDLHLDAGIAGLCILAALLLAYLSWKYIEAPFRRRSPGGTSVVDRRAIFIGAGLGGAALAAVSAVVVLGNGWPTRLPPDIRLTYAQAMDKSALRVECMKSAAPCLLGDADAGAPTVLLWGDSHAAALIPGFDAWLRARGQVGAGAAKSACPPLLGLARGDQGPGHRCDRFNAQVIDYMDSTPSLTHVILAGRWALAQSGLRAPGERQEAARLVLAEPWTGDGTAPEGNAALFDHGLARTLDALEERGVTVYILDGIPEIGYNVPRAFVQTAFLGKSTNAPPGLDDYLDRHAGVDAQLDKVLAGRAVTRIPVGPVMCAEACLVEKDGVLLYEDDDHLTADGAVWLLETVLP